MAFEGVQNLWNDGYKFGNIVNSLWQGSFGAGGLSDLLFGWAPYTSGNSWDLSGSWRDDEESFSRWSQAQNEVASSVAPYKDELNVIGQQAHSESDALSLLKNLAQDDEKYRGLYLTLLSEIENNDRAWNRYVEYNKNYIPMMVDSYKKAGLNPWLAVQNMGQPGTASISSAGGSGSLSSMLNASANQDKVDIQKITSLATLLLVALKFIG